MSSSIPPCKFFNKGYCKNGTTCEFAHSKVTSSPQFVHNPQPAPITSTQQTHVNPAYPAYPAYSPYPGHYLPPPTSANQLIVYQSYDSHYVQNTPRAYSNHYDPRIPLYSPQTPNYANSPHYGQYIPPAIPYQHSLHFHPREIKTLLSYPTPLPSNNILIHFLILKSKNSVR